MASVPASGSGDRVFPVSARNPKRKGHGEQRRHATPREGRMTGDAGPRYGFGFRPLSARLWTPSAAPKVAMPRTGGRWLRPYPGLFEPPSGAGSGPERRAASTPTSSGSSAFGTGMPWVCAGQPHGLPLAHSAQQNSLSPMVKPRQVNASPQAAHTRSSIASPPLNRASAPLPVPAGAQSERYSPGRAHSLPDRPPAAFSAPGRGTRGGGSRRACGLTPLRRGAPSTAPPGASRRRAGRGAPPE